MRDRVGVVHGQTKGDIASPVMTNDGKPLVPERAHERDAVAGHGPFGIGGMIVGRRGFG
jgi:hypothetical protein